jgi:phosphomannomutase
MSPTAADLRARALDWLREDPDETTRAELQRVLDANDESQLADRFATRLAFGTAGLRGVLGAGTNRMNRSVVIRTTAGLCDYVRAQHPDAPTRGIVIGFDARRMSRRFAEDAAEVCAGLGFRAHLFTDIGPTPLLAYAVLQLGAAAGVMITASHNPPEYNGFKVYWSNGAQIVPPHDAGIAAAIDAIGSLEKIARPILKEARARGLVTDVPADLEAKYLASIIALAPHSEDARDLTIVYTPMHGVGNKLARAALAQAGFANVHSVPAQSEPDGAFPTVSFPNPEEKGALDLALSLARETRADLVLANDPDADRLAAAVHDAEGRWVQLTGNDVGVLLGHYLLTEDPSPPRDRLVVTTVVSSPMLGTIARALGVRYEETLTGFKWIANRAIEVERATGATYVFGYEEALGYAIGTSVRDKDGISAAAVFAEMAAHARAKHGRNVLDELDAIYRRFGLFVSAQHNVTLKGADGAARIERIMDAFRAEPPERVADEDVVTVTDVLRGTRLDRAKGSSEAIALPASNVLALGFGDGSRITLRPSGTEPKVKYYFDVREAVADGESVTVARERANRRLDKLRSAFVEMADARGQGP